MKKFIKMTAMEANNIQEEIKPNLFHNFMKGIPIWDY